MIANDLPAFDFGLGETADMLRDTTRNFAADEIAPRAAQIDLDNEFPMDLWKKLGDLGLLGVTVEEEYGGAGMGYTEHVVAMEEISRASASVGLSYSAHLYRESLSAWSINVWMSSCQPAKSALSSS